MAFSSPSKVTPREVSYSPAKELPSRSSSGDDERTAKRPSVGNVRNASPSTSRCVCVSCNVEQRAFTASQYCRNSSSGELRNALQTSLLSTSSSHELKKSTLRTTPGGTLNPACVASIRELAFPPT